MATAIRGHWPKPDKHVNVADLKITADPLPPTRTNPVSKYEAVFAKLKPGNCIVCKPQEAAKLKAALDKWLKNKMRKGVTTRAVSRYPLDGRGRVWLLDKQDAEKQ